MPPAKQQFSLLGIILGMGTIAILVSLTISLRSVVDFKFTCTALPPDDLPLRRWLEEQPSVAHVEIERELVTVRVRFTRSIWNRSLDIPPIEKFGYTGLKTINWTSSTSLDIPRDQRGNVSIPWCIVIGVWVTILFAHWARNALRSSQNTVAKESN